MSVSMNRRALLAAGAAATFVAASMKPLNHGCSLQTAGRSGSPVSTQGYMMSAAKTPVT